MLRVPTKSRRGVDSSAKVSLAIGDRRMLDDLCCRLRDRGLSRRDRRGNAPRRKRGDASG